jgi:glycerol uptake facilitator-like aquaporin
MVAADILAGGPITGAAMNPARWLGTAVPAGFYDHWFVYFIGPLLGAGIAALSYRFAFAQLSDLAPTRPAAPTP